LSFIILFSSIFFLNIDVKALTLYELQQKLDKQLEEEQKTKTEIKLTEKQIANTNNDIVYIYRKMEEISNEIIKKTEEISNLNKDIIEKDKEIKEIVNFIQISSSQNVYMEYIIGAETLTDFIYRLSIAEQLTNYNNNLITKMNEMIVANENKKLELKEETEKLKDQQLSLKSKLEYLGSERKKLTEYELSIEEEIANSKKVIQMYRDAGCGLHEQLTVCANRLLPPDTRFWRPMIKGVVTSEHGWRIHPITKKNSFHDGIDLSSGERYTTLIYAAASGKVSMSDYNSSMGNFVIIHHRINGTTYSTSYYHLKDRRVKAGDLVTKDTVLGLMGTTGSSTGEHLHFSIATGLRYQDYWSNSEYYSRTINPRVFINLPAGTYRYWYDRISKY